MRINSGKLQIKNRTLEEWLILIIMILPFTVALFSMISPGLGSVRYIVDLLLVVFIFLISTKKTLMIQNQMIPILILVGTLLLYTLSVYLFNFQSPFYFLWGVRNNFRFYVAFFVIALYATEELIEDIFKVFDVIFYINFFLCCFQFFVLGYQQDYLGGVFGVTKGVNGNAIVFMFVVLSRSVLSFMNGNEKAHSCFIKCTLALIVAAMAELKFFFVVFIILLLLATILTSFSWRKFVMLALGAFLIMVASTILIAIFGFDDFLSLDSIWDLATRENYASENDLNRFAAIPKISEMFLKTLPDQLFGMGLGNCDTSSFAICNTPFYQTYEYLHYSIFSCAFLFIETGYVGLFMFTLFFLFTLYISLQRFLSRTGNRLYCQMGIIMSLFCFVLLFYNSSLRTDIGYLVYFVLALPLVIVKTNKKQTD